MNTVVFKSLDPERINKAVSLYAKNLRENHPEVKRVIWFGSWIKGHPTPGSDVDLCIIVDKSDMRPRDRISDYLPLGFPLGIDLIVLTAQEFAQLNDSSPGLYKAIHAGIDV